MLRGFRMVWVEGGCSVPLVQRLRYQRYGLDRGEEYRIDHRPWKASLQVISITWYDISMLSAFLVIYNE